MNTENSGVDISKYRGVLQTWNLLGKQIFMVKREPVDLKWNDRVRENDLTRTIAPIMKYMIIPIDIKGSRVVESPDKQTLFIELNNDSNLQFKLVPAQFKNVTMEAITEALEQSEDKTLGREPILFSDLLKLTEQINRLNGTEYDKLDKIAQNAIGQAKMLKELNDFNSKSCDNYYDELGTPIVK